jgi:hypothetical protein
MAYEILDKQTSVMTTVWTLVKFDFLEEAINIPHVNPESEDDIILGIENREISEKNKLLSVEQ